MVYNLVIVIIIFVYWTLTKRNITK